MFPSGYFQSYHHDAGNKNRYHQPSRGNIPSHNASSFVEPTTGNNRNRQYQRHKASLPSSTASNSYLPNKSNWLLFQNYMQNHDLPSASGLLYHIYHIREPSQWQEKIWTMAMRYWKEPYEVFEQDMKWIIMRQEQERQQQRGSSFNNQSASSSQYHPHHRTASFDEYSQQQQHNASSINWDQYMRASAAAPSSSVPNGPPQQQHSQYSQYSATSAGELTSLNNVRTIVDDRLIYRHPEYQQSSQVHLQPSVPVMTESSRMRPTVVEEEHARHLHPQNKPSVSPIVSHGNRHNGPSSSSQLHPNSAALLSSSSSMSSAAIEKYHQQNHSPTPTSLQSANSDPAWMHRNVTPRKYRHTRMTPSEDETPRTPPSKRSLFIETASSNKTTHFVTNSHNAVLQYETIGVQTQEASESLQKPFTTDQSTQVQLISTSTSSQSDLEALESKNDLISNLQKELNKAEEHNKKLEMERAEFAEELQLLRLSSKQDSSLPQLESMRDQIATLQQEKRQLSQRVSKLQQASVDTFEMETLQRKVDHLESERDELDHLNKTLKSKINSMEIESVNQSSVMNRSLVGSTAAPVTETAMMADSILTSEPTVTLNTLNVQLVLHQWACADDGIKEHFENLLDQLKESGIIALAVKTRIHSSRRMYMDPDANGQLLFEPPCVLQGVCSILLSNGDAQTLPMLWTISDDTKVRISISQEISTTDTFPSLKSFMFQLACDMDKERYAEKWLHILSHTFELDNLGDLMQFTRSQWSQLPKHIPHGTVLKIQERIYRLKITSETAPNLEELKANVHLYSLRLKQYFHYMAEDVNNVQLLDKNAVNLGIRELSKKYYCKHALKEVNNNFLKVISSESVNLLSSFKSILMYGPRGAAQNHLVRTLPSLVGFVRLCSWDVLHHEECKLQVRTESKALEYLPCALSITDFHEYPKQKQLDILNLVDELRNVILFISTDQPHLIPPVVMKRISFQLHVGALNVRDRWKFVRRISNESGIQVEDNSQRNMLLSVTTNFTYESMKTLVEWLPVVAKERSITAWSTDFVAPCASRIAKQFDIHLGQYSIPQCFREWFRLQMPSFVSPIEEGKMYRGLFLIHTTRQNLVARFQLLSKNLSTEVVRPPLKPDSKFKRSNSLVEVPLQTTQQQFSSNQLYESLLGILVQFGISEQVEMCAMIDATTCIEECGSLHDEGKVIEHIERVVSECQKYSRSLLLFDLDGLTCAGTTLWRYIVHTCVSRAAHQHLDRKNHHTQTHAFWIGCITRNEDMNLYLEKDLVFPRNEASFRFELASTVSDAAASNNTSTALPVANSQSAPQHKPKTEHCKTCNVEFVPEESEICCFHSGQLVEIDRGTGEVNPTDKRTALLQEFIFRERSNILIWTCCYNSVNSEGCKKLKHSSTIDKKTLFAEEAEDNYEMMKVNQHLFQMRKQHMEGEEEG